MATFVALKRRVLAEPPRWDNQIFLHWPIDESLPLTFIIHISIMKHEQGLRATSELHSGGGGQASMARQESSHALACKIPPQVLRICPEGSRAGINGLDLTELCCLRCVNMAVSHDLSLRRKQLSCRGKSERPNSGARSINCSSGGQQRCETSQVSLNVSDLKHKCRRLEQQSQTWRTCLSLTWNQTVGHN